MTLALPSIAQLGLVKSVGLVLAGSLFIAIAAQINVPMFPVPMTLQTLAVLIVGLSMGARLGVATVAVYLAQGAMGLPVFANAMNGVAFAGPTAGFLVGFLLMVWIAGTAADRGWTRGIFGASAVALVASAALYLPGLAWPLLLADGFGIKAGWVGLPFGAALSGFMIPFLLGDAVKAILAALLVSGARVALSSR